VDLLDVFGSPRVASEVLNGQRALAKSHIERLSARFNVSPEGFFENRRGAAA
jgi:antitoxin component HigA of HigAB toxin-antitoxin module